MKKRRKNNKQKKGFTLIELLAVILILGIIALIAIPQVTNVISNASKGATETSAEHYVSAVNTKIGLNKLDKDSSNDIRDGIIDISTISVDMIGDTPTTGNIYVYNGSVVEADLVVNDRPVICNSKGKCNAYDRYVYWGSEGTPNSVEDCAEEASEEYTAFLRYPVINNKLGEPQACFYDGREFCVVSGNASVALSKSKSYLGLTNASERPGDNNTIIIENPTDSSKYCMIYEDTAQCNHGLKAVTINLETEKVGSIYSGSDKYFSCGISLKTGKGICSFIA